MFIDPRQATAFGAVLVAGLLILQFAHRRRTFILPWIGGWLLTAPAMLLTAVEGAPPVPRWAVGLSQALGVSAAVLFLWSADLFRQMHLVRRAQIRWFALFSGALVLAPLALDARSALVPGHLASAAILAGAGALYAAVLLERRLIGAGMIACVLLGLGIANLAAVFVILRDATPDLALELLLLQAILYACGALGVHVLVFEDMTYELRATNRRLEAVQEELLQAAVTDPLTGCYNRRFFEQVIDRELQRHARFALPLSLLFIDLDRFKAINDTMGHEAGDEVLGYISRFLRQHIREADYIFRWGGDEFLVMITCTAAEVRNKASALKAAFDTAPEAVDLPPGLGLSIGWIEVPGGTTDLAPFIDEADRLMYEDKGRR
jgi:diguanylate cyclase (GGDEF)-like protein